MYKWRVWLWKNSKRNENGEYVDNTEYTRYVVAPIFLEDRLDETLDTGEIILKSMPISTREAFPPKTKFRLERYLRDDYSDEPKKWDMVVEHDDVEEFAGCPEICTHRIHLIEASVIAQGMHVDNIALTYELQDVTLNYKTVVGKSDTLADRGKIDIAPQKEFRSPVHSNPQIQGTNGTYYFENSYNYRWVGGDDLRALKYELDGSEARAIEFTIPTLMAQGCYRTGEWRDIFELQTQTRIYCRLYKSDGSLVSEVIQEERICGPINFGESYTDEVYGIAKQASVGGSSNNLPSVARGTRISDYDYNYKGLLVTPKQFSELYNASAGWDISTENSDAQSKTISFTTLILTEEQRNAKMYYEYEISCTRYSNMVLPIYYSRGCSITNNSNGTHQNMLSASTETIKASALYVNAKFRVVDLSVLEEGDAFLASAREYNCYDLVRKAMLTCDTQIFDNDIIGLDELEYPIKIGDEVAVKLRGYKMYETTFEQKNLWEVFLQSGHYLHSAPYLEFADDGTDRFELKYQPLGSTRKKIDKNNKITVFNSRNLSEFFTQYDSYVTNLFSPQNVIEEWGVVKTSDGNYLVSNNTAEIHVKCPLEEVIEFDLTYRGVTASALNMLFEESIYSILTPSRDVRPSKGCALYFKLGDTKIIGLNYVPPSVNNDAPYALKSILSILFGVNASENIQFNDIRYHIKYRTRDSLRVSQVRPDLQNFMKNSSYEKYPHHEQYYGQQDKIVDSERFSANLFGKLIRVGNAVYQRQEQVVNVADEKESGDLVTINNEPYYVTTVENEFYADVILQKVTYTKNFNQLSQIVTIPSEPRFYEVSERSQVRREVRLMDFLLLTTKQNATAVNPTFISRSKWREIVKSMIFADGSFALPNFAYTRFKADKRRLHNGIQTNKLFPSSEITRTSNNSMRPKASGEHRDVIVPLLHFPLKNAIVFEWDMDDNFKAGDSIDTTISGTGNTNDDAYFSMQPVRYCDAMGRADLFDFRLFNKTNWTIEQVRRLPFAESGDFVPTESESAFCLPDRLSIGLDKDNREALSFNYQINLLQEDSTFVTYSNLFGHKSGRLKMCFLNTEASLFDGGMAITNRTIVADNVTYSLENTLRNAIEIRITRPTNIDASAVKSIVLYEEDGASKYAYIAKNVGSVADMEKFNSWWLYPIFTQ